MTRIVLTFAVAVLLSLSAGCSTEPIDVQKIDVQSMDDVGDLIDVLEGEDGQARSQHTARLQAAKKLGELGPEAVEAIPALLEALEKHGQGRIVTEVTYKGELLPEE